MPHPNCAVKEKLFARYAEAAAALGEIGRRIANASAGEDIEAFEALWKECEAAREQCIHIRRQISAHVQIHGCGLFR